MELMHHKVTVVKAGLPSICSAHLFPETVSLEVNFMTVFLNHSCPRFYQVTRVEILIWTGGFRQARVTHATKAEELAWILFT